MQPTANSVAFIRETRMVSRLCARRLMAGVRCLEETMLMPMFGFIFTLLVVGGLGTLVAIGDPQNARLAPYIGFIALFAGIGALSLSLLLALIGQQVLRSDTLSGLGFFAGYVLGGLGGAAFGLHRAIRRRSRIESGVDA
jgi:hypothetical protein